MLEAGKMGKRKGLSESDTGQIVMSKRLGQRIFKTAALVGCSQSAVICIFKKWSKERTVVNRRQGHGWSRLVDSREELRLASMVRSNRLDTVAQIAEEVAKVAQWFEEHNESEVLCWPLNSPELNLINHVWDVVDKQVRSMEVPTLNLQELKDVLLSSLSQIPQHTFRGQLEFKP